jgi:hypothetical protein
VNDKFDSITEEHSAEYMGCITVGGDLYETLPVALERHYGRRITEFKR